MGEKLQETKRLKRVTLSFKETEMRVIDVAMFFLNDNLKKGKIAIDFLGIKEEDALKVHKKIERSFDKIRGLKNGKTDK